jgi:hypothetical protein
MHAVSLNVRRFTTALLLAMLTIVTGFSPVPARAATSKGPIHVTVFAVNTDGPKFVAIISGAIADYGSAVANGKSTELTLHLAKGKFSLNVAKLDAKLVSETAGEPLFSATCSDYFDVKGTVTIVAGSGTGAYRRIAGSFASSITVNEDQGLPCSHATTPFRQIFVLNGIGTISK